MNKRHFRTWQWENNRRVSGLCSWVELHVQNSVIWNLYALLYRWGTPFGEWTLYDVTVLLADLSTIAVKRRRYWHGLNAYSSDWGFFTIQYEALLSLSHKHMCVCDTQYNQLPLLHHISTCTYSSSISKSHSQSAMPSIFNHTLNDHSVHVRAKVMHTRKVNKIALKIPCFTSSPQQHFRQQACIFWQQAPPLLANLYWR